MTGFQIYAYVKRRHTETGVRVLVNAMVPAVAASAFRRRDTTLQRVPTMGI